MQTFLVWLECSRWCNDQFFERSWWNWFNFCCVRCTKGTIYGLFCSLWL